MLLSCSVGITPKLLGSGLLLVFIAALGVHVCLCKCGPSNLKLV